MSISSVVLTMFWWLRPSGSRAHRFPVRCMVSEARPPHPVRARVHLVDAKGSLLDPSCRASRERPMPSQRKPSMNALRILVVEDNAVIGMLLSLTLKAMGHEVCAVETSEEGAVAAALRCRPDLMVVDAALGKAAASGRSRPSCGRGMCRTSS